jgi:tRNA nucleotidyltransferase/poly(A) polymerase
MDEAAIRAHAGEGAYVVGGAVRDELLGRPVLDLDVACGDPEGAARAHADATGGALFPLSERHGAWRVAFRDGRTVDFTPLRNGIEADLATRDFTVNAIARPLGSRELVDPLGGRADLDRRTLRVVTPDVFRDDPLRLLRAVRLEEELGFRLEDATAALVRRDAALVDRPAGERILDELARLSEAGFRRLDELGLLAPLGGSLERLDAVAPAEHADYLLVVTLGEALLRLPTSNETRRFARRLLAARPPEDDSARALHRFRRATEPWALEALAYLGRGDLAGAIEEARARDPGEPLLRGDELGLPPGPEIGRLLALVEEERAAGTISTREEALELVRRFATPPT